MDKVTFRIPQMWADHHVLAVRQALGQITGVEGVTASSLYQDVVVQFDPAATNADALVAALAGAGYEVNTPPGLPAYPPRISDTSDWFRFQDRISETDMRDLEMSGDFRKY